jgi:hypothetical protein
MVISRGKMASGMLQRAQVIYTSSCTSGRFPAWLLSFVIWSPIAHSLIEQGKSLLHPLSISKNLPSCQLISKQFFLFCLILHFKGMELYPRNSLHYEGKIEVILILTFWKPLYLIRHFVNLGKMWLGYQ